MGNILVNDNLDKLPTLEELIKRYEKRKFRLIGKVESPDEEMKNRSSGSMMFLYANLHLIEEKDKNLIATFKKRATKYLVGAFITSLLINRYVFPIVGSWSYKYPWFLRAPLRLSLFFLPFIYVYKYNLDLYTRGSLYMADKYMDRIPPYIKIQDPRLINPFLEDDLKNKPN